MNILISIFFALILIFLVSKVKINIKHLQKYQKSLKIHFNVNLGVYLFGFIKIFGVTLKEDGIHFLFFRFPYNKIKIDKKSIKTVKEFSIIDILKSLNLKLDKFYINLNIGTENVMLTVFTVFIISTFLSIVSSKNRKQINFKNYYYKITPIYNSNEFIFYTSMQISIKILNIIKTLVSINKNTKKRKQYNFHINKSPIKI